MFWNHRVNEVERGHGGFRIGGGTEQERVNPVKAAHPDWLIRSWWWQGNWNLAVEEVRRYKLGILAELARQYDFDGFQLDFARHVPHLPPGRQWELRDGVTEFIASVRSMLLQRAEERGRPLLLAVRIPETLEGCRIDGFDVQQWVESNLVDILILGTRAMNVDIRAFRRMVDGKPIKLIPSFDGWHHTDGYRLQPIEYLRGVFGNWWNQGADGVGTFNWAGGSPEMALRIGAHAGPAAQQAAYSEIGGWLTIDGKARFYAVERRGGYHTAEGYFGRNDTAPLPLLLRNNGQAAELTLPVWEQPREETIYTLRIILYSLLPTDEIGIAINGQPADGMQRDPDWKDPQIHSPEPQPPSSGHSPLKPAESQQLACVQVRLAAEQLRQGDNRIAVQVIKRGPFRPGQDIKLEKVELHV
jgi:hypothetical protein